MLLIPESYPAENFWAPILPLDPPAWSLFFEVLASVLFGLVVWRGRLRWSLRSSVSRARRW